MTSIVWRETGSEMAQFLFDGVWVDECHLDIVKGVAYLQWDAHMNGFLTHEED
jgi:hypothetical protein